MGSATVLAREAATAALSARSDVTLDTAREFFFVAQTVAQSPQLSAALSDGAAPSGAREAAVATIFADNSAAVRDVLAVVARQRWSSASDMVDEIEELGIRATVIAEPDVDLEGEVFEFSRLVAVEPDLELALGSKLGNDTAKADIVEKLLAPTANPGTTLVVASLVRQARGRRIRRLLTRAIDIISSQRGRLVATVHSASALTDAQREKLGAALSRRYGAQVDLNVVRDPSIVGGLRVRVADEVIDGSISTRLAELRQKLAG